MNDRSHTPDDLYIPPDALEVVLQMFTGPFDLLLYLIKKHDIDILDLPVSSLTDQYVAYLEEMASSQFDLAAEYMVMAAYLIHLKSRMLMPKPVIEVEDEEEIEDPREALVRQLQLYQIIQAQSEALGQLTHADRDFLPIAGLTMPSGCEQHVEPVSLMSLVLAYQGVHAREHLTQSYAVSGEQQSFAATMQHLHQVIASGQVRTFQDCLAYARTKESLAQHFLAMLTLVNQSQIDILQDASGGPIQVLPLGASTVREKVVYG